MKKTVLCVLLLIMPLSILCAWYAAQVYYSDFHWLDNRRFMVLRTVEYTGAAGSHAEILVVDSRDGSRLPLTPLIKGFAYSLKGGKLFVHTDWDILLFDFSEAPSPRPRVIYNLRPSSDFKRIEDLEWIADGKLVFTVFSAYNGLEQVVFDYNTGQKTALTHISDEERAQLFRRERARSLYKHRDPGNAYLIQVSANKEYKSAARDLETLKDRSPCIIFENNYYKVFLGLFDYERDAKKALTGIKRLGYGKAFIISKQTYDIGSTLMAEGSNVWLKTAAGPRPLFSSAGSVSPVAVYGDYFIFLRNSSVYVLQIKTARLTRLTMPLHEELNDNGDRYNLRWDKASRRIIFPHSDGTQTSCWSIGADGTGLTRLKGEGSAACTAGVEGLYPLETLDKLVQNYYAEWFRSGDSKEYTLEIPSQGAGSLVIRFHFTSSGTYWSDSVSVKSGDKKRLLLESISNW